MDLAEIVARWCAGSTPSLDALHHIGLKAAGSGLAADQLLQPGRIAQVGVAAGKPVLQAASQLLGFTSFFENFIQIAVLMIAWFVVLVSFFIVAIQLFVTLIEFKLTTLAGFVLIPFGLFNETAFTSGSSGAGGSGGSSSSSGMSSGAGGHSGASERGSQGSSGREAQGSEGGKQTTGQSSQSGSSSQRSKEREAQGSEQGKKSGQSRSS